jgi:hypothetical protein
VNLPGPKYLSNPKKINLAIAFNKLVGTVKKNVDFRVKQAKEENRN